MTDDETVKKPVKNKAWFKHITSDILRAAAVNDQPQNLALPLPIHQQPSQTTDMFAVAELEKNRGNK